MSDAFTDRATRAILAAARSEHDFAGWLAGVLCAVAGQLGSSYALTGGRPGCWEAGHVMQLVHGTAGYDDEYLPGSLPGYGITDEKARAIRDDALYSELTQREIAALHGVAGSTVSNIGSGRTWGWLGDDRELEIDAGVAEMKAAGDQDVLGMLGPDGAR